MKTKSLYIAALACLLGSCSENIMDDINKDTYHPQPDIVNAKFMVTNAVTSAAFSIWNGDYAFYVSSYTEQLFGTGNNQLMKAEVRNRMETASSTTFNNVWNSTYTGLTNIKQIMEKTEEGQTNAGQTDILGIGLVLWVMDFEALTDLHGDIPYSEALVTMQPKIDSQESIYEDLLKKIDQAITSLSDAADKKMNNCGSQDLLFNGDPKKWLGLAYALKARLLMNTSFRNPSVWTDVVTAAQAALDNGFAGAYFAKFNGVDCDNPWSAFFWSRYYTGANETLLDIMTERDDPRADVYAVDYFDTGVLAAPAGDDDLAGTTETVGCPIWLDNGAAKSPLFSLAEIHFILAEAKSRLGQDATDSFHSAIEASFDDYAEASGESVGNAADYYASLPVSFEEIMVQKYIAQARSEMIQTYNDMRRLSAEGKSVITLRNPHNNENGQNQWPLRLPYGNSDVVSNPNVTAAFGSGNDAGNYLFTENIWLFGGTR